MLVILSLLLAIAYAYNDHQYPQCNVGMKLFSLENSKAICAPLVVHHTCVYQCVWRSSCKKTPHWHAFDGRRTFVAGIVVSPNHLVLCCASLATLTLKNESNMEMCEWRNDEPVSRLYASLRIQPVMQVNEYIRNVAFFDDSADDGIIRIRIEVCAFQVEQKLCDLKVNRLK
ncbi:hypothetical protein Tcan_10140 [Toxocara canis]|uniref:Uncharacterized protein n=1 Tax=Toxocara canis TaxID=6265 RepID=A0A0B2VAK6_TOXCA|nr:hypothetical protein Tcan_10140 [Toxocara canis]